MGTVNALKSTIPWESVPNKTVRKKKLRDLLKSLNVKEGSLLKNAPLPEDFGTCWACFMDITKCQLDEYREKYSAKIEHEESCPLCGYDHWKGRVWYPFKLIRDMEIGNPSTRFPKGV